MWTIHIKIVPQGIVNATSSKCAEKIVDRIYSQRQNRYRLKLTQRNLRVRNFVLLKEDNVAPGLWPIARITEDFPGADGLVRSVKIRTPKNRADKIIEKYNDCAELFIASSKHSIEG